MRKAYLVGEPETKVAVTESNIPDTVTIRVLAGSVTLTKSEFNDLCNLRYSISYAEYPAAVTPLINPTSAPDTDDIPF